MSDVIVDSCVAAKWVLAEEGSRHAAHLFKSVRGAGDRLILLDVALAEAANAVWKQHHRGLIALSDAERLLRDLLTVQIEIRPSRRLLQPAFTIAARYDRSVYDALFVALTQDLKLPGVTADEPLWQAVHADFPNIVLLRDWR